MIQRGIILISVLFVALCGMQSCSVIDEPNCKVNYVQYRYRNNDGEVATHQINSVTEFAFDQSGILGKVNRNITNGKVAKRPIEVPDGHWTILSFGNLTDASEVIDIATQGEVLVGKTKMTDIRVRLKQQPPTNLLSYADDATNKVGNSDTYYFAKVDLDVKGGTTNEIHTVEMSNAHIRLSVKVIFDDPTLIPSFIENLHTKLEYVPYEYMMTSTDKRDPYYKIDYPTPDVTSEVATLLTTLRPTIGSVGELTFDIFGLRWETGKAPVLSLWNGDEPLLVKPGTSVSKDLDLNRYFENEMIDLTNTRVQFFNLLVRVAIDGTVTISDLSVYDWEDGGTMGW